MKRLYNFLVILLIPALAIAQSDMTKSPQDAERGPIIDNISADIGNTSNRQDANQSVQSIGSSSGQQGQGSQSSGAQSGENGAQRLQSETTSRSNDDSSPIERIRQSLRFYPNPAVSELNVELGSEYEVRIALLNVLGQEIFSTEGDMDRVKIYLSDFPRGAYFLTIQYQGQVVVNRIELVQ